MNISSNSKRIDVVDPATIYELEDEVEKSVSSKKTKKNHKGIHFRKVSNKL